MASHAALVGREEVIARQTLSREVAAQIAVHQVNVAKRPEIVTLQAVFMDVTQRGLDVTQLISSFGREVDIQTLRHNAAIVAKTDALDCYVGWQVVRHAAVAEQQPVNVWVAPATFQKKRHPERPLAEVWNDKHNTRRWFYHRELNVKVEIEGNAMPLITVILII